MLQTGSPTGNPELDPCYKTQPDKTTVPYLVLHWVREKTTKVLRNKVLRFFANSPKSQPLLLINLVHT
jgi:hypothetical protein